MSVRRIVISSAILALAIAGGLLLRRDSSPAETMEAAPRTPPATATEPSDPIDVGAEAPVRAELAATTTMLTVLDAKTRKPVAGAQGWVLNSIPVDSDKVGWDALE